MSDDEERYKFQLSRVIGEEGDEPGMFAFPSDVAYGPDGLLYVADSDNHRVQVLTLEGEFVREIGEFGREAGQMRHPGYLAFGSDNILYVVEWGNRRIQVFDPSGTTQRIIDGSQIEGWGEPNGVAVAPDGTLFVADKAAGRIWLLDEQGNLLQSIAEHLHTPTCPVLDATNTLYVGDYYEDGDIRMGSTIHLFLTDGKPLRTIGSQGKGTSDLDAPEGLALDDQGLIYVSQREAHRVSIFTPEGKWVGKVGRFGNDPGGFYYPLGVAILPGNHVAVADSWNHRIQIFEPA